MCRPRGTRRRLVAGGVTFAGGRGPERGYQVQHTAVLRKKLQVILCLLCSGQRRLRKVVSVGPVALFEGRSQRTAKPQSGAYPRTPLRLGRYRTRRPPLLLELLPQTPADRAVWQRCQPRGMRLRHIPLCGQPSRLAQVQSHIDDLCRVHVEPHIGVPGREVCGGRSWPCSLLPSKGAVCFLVFRGGASVLLRSLVDRTRVRMCGRVRGQASVGGVRGTRGPLAQRCMVGPSE